MNLKDTRDQIAQFATTLFASFHLVLAPRTLAKRASRMSGKRLLVELVALSVTSAFLLLLLRSILSLRVDFSQIASASAFLLAFSLSFSLVFLGAFAFSGLPLRRVLICSAYFSACSLTVSVLPALVSLVVFLYSEVYLFYYLYFIFFLAVVFVTAIVYPIVLNRGMHRLFSVLLALALLAVTNVTLYGIYQALPELYRNDTKHIYDPIMKENIGYDLVHEGKSDYIISNSLLTIGLLKMHVASGSFSSLDSVSEEITALTSQKDHLSNLLAMLHFRRNRRIVESNLEIVELFGAIGAQINRISPVPAETEGTLLTLRQRLDAVSTKLQHKGAEIESAVEQVKQLRQRFDELSSRPKVDATAADDLTRQIQSLIKGQEGLLREFDSISAEQKGISEGIDQVRSYTVQIRENTDAIKEINYLISVLNNAVKRATRHYQEETAILRFQSSLPLIF